MIDLAKPYLFADEATKLELMEYYNENCFELVKKERRYRIQPNDNWCAMFTSVMAHKAGLSADVFPYEVSVQQQLFWAKERGLFVTDWEEVQPNDLILFDWNRDGWSDHVGLVVKIDRDLVTSIEGNINGTVNYRTVSSKSKSIIGFIKVDR